MTENTIIRDSIVAAGCGVMRLPVSNPKDSNLILQLCLLPKLRGKSDVDRDIKNNNCFY